MSARNSNPKCLDVFGKNMAIADDLTLFRATIDEMLWRLRGDKKLEAQARELQNEVVKVQLRHTLAALHALKRDDGDELVGKSSISQKRARP